MVRAMATTTTSDGKVEVIHAYAESDKIGPIGGKRSVFEDEAELRRTLVSEFQATANAARTAAASVERDPAAAVHEYRKALRRARAVLALVAGALPRGERKALSRALGEARRALSAARDQAVAPDAVRSASLGDGERETAQAVLAAVGEAAPATSEIEQLLAEGAARAAAQVEALEAALPPAITWDVVAAGVRDVYGRARDARKQAKRSRRAFHTWRRRSKELTYQLELLAGYAGERVTELARDLDRVTDLQGPAVDLLMLRQLVRAHGAPGDASDQLAGAIEDQLDVLIDEARQAGKDVFARKPRRFARRLTKALRRDLAPAPGADDTAAD